MSNDNTTSNDPLGFVRNMWGNMGFSLPGMVAPTFDLGELEKRIKDLKAVESWLRMNLSMLQMTIQGLEMQTTTLTAVKTMGSMAANAAQQAAQSMSQPTPAPAPAVAAPAPAPEPALAADAPTADAAGAFSQAAMWPWHLMQQMQEQLQQQADAVQAKQATERSAKPAAKKTPAAPKRPRKPAA